MARRWIVGVVALVLAGFGGLTAASAEPGERLVELPSCAAPTPLPEPAAGRTGGDTEVSFQVPALTTLRVVDGAVVAAATNTGCAPRPSDTFVTEDRAATEAEVAEALDRFTSGDWTTPGAWHRP